MNENFFGTYLTENGNTAVVVSKSTMVVGGKKEVIWVGFVLRDTHQTLCVWDKNGERLTDIKNGDPMWNLREAVKEKAY